MAKNKAKSFSTVEEVFKKYIPNYKPLVADRTQIPKVFNNSIRVNYAKNLLDLFEKRILCKK
jgi:hypothetical protein